MRSPVLAELKLILQRAVSEPGQLSTTISEFLLTYDSVPDKRIALGGAQWRSLERLAYELRYYAPEETPDETLLNDEQALVLIREVLIEVS